MKKKSILCALIVPTIFLGTLTSCDKKEEPTPTVETSNYKEVDESIYEKVFNELKKSFDDINYEYFKKLVNVQKSDVISLSYLSSYVRLDYEGSFVEKSITAKDESGVLTKTTSIYTNNEWEIESISKYFNEKEYLYYQTGIDIHNVKFKAEYTYDDHHNRTSYIERSYINNEWVKTYEDNYINGEKVTVYEIKLTKDGSYDSKIERIVENETRRTIESKYISGEWVKIREHISDNNRYEDIYLITFNDDGSFDSKFEKQYDDNDQLSKEIVSKYVNNEWKIIKVITYVDGIKKESYTISLNEDGSYDTKTEYTHSEDILVLTESEFKYQDGNWVKISEYKTFAYGPGQVKKRTYYFDLETNEKIESEYNEKGDILTSEESKYINDSWVKVAISIYERNTDGGLVHFVKSEFINNKWLKTEETNYMVIDFIYKDYKYDSSCNLVCETYYKENSLLDIDHKDEYSYFQDSVTKISSYYDDLNNLKEVYTYSFKDSKAILQYKVLFNSDGSYKTKYDYEYSNSLEDNQYYLTKNEYVSNNWLEVGRYFVEDDFLLPQYEISLDRGSYYTKHEYIYDNFRNIISDISYKYENNQWVFDSSITREYDAYNNFLRESKKEYIDEKWVLFDEYVCINGEIYSLYHREESSSLPEIVENEYDVDGKIITCQWSIEIDDKLYPHKKFENKYDSFGNLILTTWSLDESTNGNWTFSSKIENKYDKNNNLIEDVYSNYSSGKWVLISKSEYFYDSNGDKVGTTNSMYDNNAWVPYTKCEFESDDKGNVISLEGSSLNYDSWQISYRYEYTYDDLSNLISKTYYYYSQGLPFYKIDYTYDSFGKETSKIKLNYRNGEWIYESKNEFTYDEFGNKLSDSLLGYSSGQWLHYYMNEYTYDASGNKLSETYLSNNGGKLEVMSKHEYTYNKFGKMLSDKYLENSNNEMKMLTLEEYKYDDFGFKYMRIDGYWIYFDEAI